MKNKITIDEVFFSLQGEGERTGCPSVFVRLAGCNLTCAGFGCSTTSPIDESVIYGCDTIPAVSKKHFGSTWESITVKECISKILTHAKVGLEEKPDIVFTGGEPMLQHKGALEEVVMYLISSGYRVYIETNGTIPVDFETNSIYKGVRFNISPKLSNSGEPFKSRMKYGVLSSYIKNSRKCFLKFVLGPNSANEIEEINHCVEGINTPCSVYLMPLGETSEKLKQNDKQVFRLAIEHGYRYSDRIHIRIFEDMKGI